MKYAFLAVALAISTHVYADESARQAKISKIIEAQGLQQMLQQQLDQSKAQAGDLGKDLYRKLLSEREIAEGQENPKMRQIFTRYVERSADMFSAKELVETWSRFYGKNLSDAELEKILAYYKSPVGKKDVAAAQAAMVGFSQVVGDETAKRAKEHLRQMIADINAVIDADNSPANTGVAR
jgi:hypothetical protein